MAKKDRHPKHVTGGPNPDHKVNQHAPIFYDRRTKKNRDRSSQNRNAIRDSKEN